MGDLSVAHDSHSFLKFLCGRPDISQVVEWIQTCQVSNVSDLCKNLTNEENDQLWMFLHEHINNPAQGHSNDILHMTFIKFMCALLDDVIHMDVVYVPPPMLTCFLILHRMLPTVYKVDEDVSVRLSTLCLKWWQSNFPSRHKVIINAILVFLNKAPSAILFVKRLWSFKDALTVLNLSQEIDPESSLNQVKTKLLSLPSNNVFYKCEEGRKLLSLLFALDFTPRIVHESFKAALVKCSKERPLQIGQIYYRTWKALEGDRRWEFERTCIQNCIHCSVYCKPNNASHMRQLLKFFCDKKGIPAVEVMLVKLVEPILWRSLNAPNACVRANATAIFLMLYPLRGDADNSLQENMDYFTKQEQFIRSLSTDCSALVRVAWLEGMTELLVRCWEELSVEMLKFILRETILNSLSLDASSIEVRKNIYFLVERLLKWCVASIPLMSKMLPQLLIRGLNDNSDKVRECASLVLLAVRNHPGIKLWDVISMDLLLSRLSVESNTRVRCRIVQILVPSFMPDNIDKRLSRFASLVKKNVDAARNLSLHLHSFISVPECANQISYMISGVRMCVLKAETNEESYNMTMDDEPDKTTDALVSQAMNEVDASDAMLMSGLLDCASIIWVSILAKLTKPENNSVKLKLFKTTGRVLPACVNYLKNDRAVDVLMFIGGQLPPSYAKYTVKSVLSSLKQCTIESDRGSLSKREESYVLSAALWNMPDLIDLAQEWIESALGSKPTRHSTPLSRPPKVVRIMENKREIVPQPRLGILYMKCILHRRQSREILIHSCPEQIVPLRDMLDKFKPIIENYVNCGEKACDLSAEDMACIEEIKSSLTIFSAEADTDNIEQALEWQLQQINWYSKHVISAIDSCEGDSSKQEYIFTLIQAFLNNAGNWVLADYFGLPLTSALSEIIAQILTSQNGSCLWGEIARLTGQIAEYLLLSESPRSTVVIIKPILQLLIRRLADKLKTDPLTENELSCCEPLRELMINLGVAAPSVIKDEFKLSLVPLLLSNSLLELTELVERTNMINTPEDNDWAWPAWTQFIHATFAKQKPLINLYASELERCLQSGVLSTSKRLAAAALLIYFINSLKADLKTVAACKYSLLHSIEHVDPLKSTEICSSTLQLLDLIHT